ncbi:RING-H2 finger protein ATL43 [Prunus yedoensis var. nudiflora]|uniref:RING-type E3 ubiquitin transferase n=1 Tax=Prunus yedoensis var. nudiflora TaxID=2094558 RepID=A0A314Z203_PRUYE|nr:RING-H2 finger protein ATL43 [Prunus yedoensis var. nudiflora]
MGLVFLFLKPTTSSTTTFFFLLLFFLLTFLSFLTAPTLADTTRHVSTPDFGDIVTISSNPSPSPPNVGPAKASSFRPSIAIIVGVLTTLFSITFLLLLYAKHCKRGALVVVTGNSNSGPSGSTQRKNSGIDRSVVESLPVFRFGSLRGQKEGLECAVCLTRFDRAEVLRLLPKCKHAFHVECVDTWLDAHSTCPLCRYRVDPEDVLLVDDASKILHSQQSSDVVLDIENDPGYRRISGRHSFAGEQRPGNPILTWSFRRSLDSWTAFRKKSEPSIVGCLDRPRKDGLLLGQDRTRLEHRIIISPGLACGPGGLHQRWSDVQPSDLLYLRSEMIMSEGLPRQPPQQNENNNADAQQVIAVLAGPPGPVRPAGIVESRRSWSCGGGSSVINSRSVSEITGLSRFSNRARSNESLSQHQQQQQQRQLKLVARWLAWVSSLSRPGIRTERTTTPTPPPVC